MKKFKKLVSLVIASMLTAGTISAATAGAVGYFKNGDQLDAELDEYILINDENALYGGAYINSKDSSNMIFINEAKSNWVEMCISRDADVEKIEKIIMDICPNAKISIGTPTLFEGSDEYLRSLCVRGYEGKLPYKESREKNITLEQARKIYEAIKESGDFKSTVGIETYEYNEIAYMPQYTETYLTAYFAENKDEIEKYAAEKGIKCHFENLYDDDAEFKLVPDEKLTVMEHYQLAEQIYSDLGIAPFKPIQETLAAEGETSVIDMHNNTVGDANEDGELDMSDAVYIMQCCSNPDKYKLTAQGRYNADFNDDGITNEDALAIQKTLLEIE